jgi:endonuclease YncB( thermonuclease family)
MCIERPAMIPGMPATASAAVRLFLMALTFFPEPDAKLHEFTGKVVHIADGDTLTVLDADKVQHKNRRHGIDAPKEGQATQAPSRS